EPTNDGEVHLEVRQVYSSGISRQRPEIVKDHIHGRKIERHEEGREARLKSTQQTNGAAKFNDGCATEHEANDDWIRDVLGRDVSDITFPAKNFAVSTRQENDAQQNPAEQSENCGSHGICRD